MGLYEAGEIWFNRLNVRHVLTMIDPAANQARSEISHSKHFSPQKQTAPSDECVLRSVWFITFSGSPELHHQNHSICLKHPSAAVSSPSILAGWYGSQHIPDLKTFRLISLFYFPHDCLFLICETAIWKGSVGYLQWDKVLGWWTKSIFLARTHAHSLTHGEYFALGVQYDTYPKHRLWICLILQ